MEVHVTTIDQLKERSATLYQFEPLVAQSNNVSKMVTQATVSKIIYDHRSKSKLKIYTLFLICYYVLITFYQEQSIKYEKQVKSFERQLANIENNKINQSIGALKHKVTNLYLFLV